MKETLKEAGYEHLRFENGTHILKDVHTGRLERWVKNKNHASYGLIYKNTHLEFCGGYREKTNEC